MPFFIDFEMNSKLFFGGVCVPSIYRNICLSFAIYNFVLNNLINLNKRLSIRNH